MNRRRFLLGCTAAAGALAAPLRDVVVGLIGAGARGMQLLQTCLDLPGIRIGAICETYEPRFFGSVALARSRGHKARYYRIYTDLLADTDLDAILIATPDFWHARMTLEAVSAGKDVYVEQPLCRTWQEGLRMLRAEKESGRLIQVGVRNPPVVARATGAGPYLRPGLLTRGPAKLPEPLNFQDWQAGAQNKGPYSPDRFLNWRLYPEYGAGMFADLASGVVPAGFGFPQMVVARGTRLQSDGWDALRRASATITYTDGHTLELSIDATAAPLKPEAPDLGAFFESVRTRRPPAATVAATFPATLACLMAETSARSGQPCTWDESRREVRS